MFSLIIIWLYITFVYFIRRVFLFSSPYHWRHNLIRESHLSMWRWKLTFLVRENEEIDHFIFFMIYWQQKFCFYLVCWFVFFPAQLYKSTNSFLLTFFLAVVPFCFFNFRRLEKKIVDWIISWHFIWTYSLFDERERKKENERNCQRFFQNLLSSIFFL